MPKKPKKNIVTEETKSVDVHPVDTTTQTTVEQSKATSTQLSIFDVMQRRMERESAM